jgi:hypothetical protein
MVDHLKEAKFFAQAVDESTRLPLRDWGRIAVLTIGYALIAIAERLPPAAETASECQARLKEEQGGV